MRISTDTLAWHPSRANAVASILIVFLSVGAMGSSCSSTVVPASFDIPGGDVEVAGLIDPHLHFTLPVTLNGQGPYYFLVDTGAGTTVVSTRLGNSLPPGNGPNIATTGVGGDVNARFVRIDSLGIGSMQFNNFLAQVIDVQEPSGGVYEGIVGLPVFHNVTMRIDHPRKTLRVQTSLLDQHTCNRAISGADLYSNGAFSLAMTSINVVGRDVDAILDSGSEGVLTLPNSYSDLPWIGALANMTVSGVAGTETNRRGTLNGVVQVACQTSNSPPIYLSAFPYPALGAGGWQKLILFIDQRSKLMRLQGPDCGPTPDCVTPDPTTLCTSLAGTWSTDLGDMKFEFADDGGLNGVGKDLMCPEFGGYLTQGSPGCANCLTLTGQWITRPTDGPECRPPKRGSLNQDYGPIEFVFSADLSSFVGKWNYVPYGFYEDIGWQPWNGRRIACE